MKDFSDAAVSLEPQAAIDEAIGLQGVVSPVLEVAPDDAASSHDQEDQPETVSELKFHEAANLFPLLPRESDEFRALVDDIRKNGQRERIIVTPDGRIVDGRNRYMACRELGIKPSTKVYDEDEYGSDATAFVISMNIHRRHLTPRERAELLLRAKPLVERIKEEAKERQAAGANKTLASSDAKVENGPTGKVSKILADFIGVGPATMERAMRDEKKRDQAISEDRPKEEPKKRRDPSLPYKEIKEAIPAVSDEELFKIVKESIQQERIPKGDLIELLTLLIRTMKVSDVDRAEIETVFLKSFPKPDQE